ncbi:MAG: hypothetical protein JWP35_3615 [Caulobacter sp.]|nr:hypothetical protein [Caulobacter sp.]
MSFQAYLDTVRAKTGLGPDEFRVLAEQKGLLGAKAAPVMAWLKADYGLGQGHAMCIWASIKADGAPVRPGPEARIDALFSGGKAGWRAVYEGLLATARGYGDDVGVSPTDSYVSLVRGKGKFAIVAPGASFLDIGFKRPGVAATDRFVSAAGWNNMLTHRVRLAAGETVDGEVLEWLRASYEAAGRKVKG